MFGSTFTFAIVCALGGLALGFVLSRTIRGRREAADARKRAAAPVTYASRQEARKAQREREKADRKP
ncbi:MAG: hypothetical protein FJX62_10875 [Alphaproteobacteria bacterium]|nr:hypothetical protein [Alphaproteobacteria bacterium]